MDMVSICSGKRWIWTPSLNLLSYMYLPTTGINYLSTKDRFRSGLQEGIWITGILPAWTSPPFFVQEKTLLPPRSGTKVNGERKAKYHYVRHLFYREIAIMK